MNKKKVFNLGILAIVAFGLISMPVKANAELSGYFTPYGSTSFNNNQNYSPAPTYYYPPAPTVIYTAPNPVAYVNYTPQPAPIATVYSSGTNPNAVATSTTPKTVAKAKTTTTKDTTIAKTDTSANNSLVASAIFGSSGFLPSGIIQWILFAILVLSIVILVRKIYGADEAYHAVPLKHE